MPWLARDKTKGLGKRWYVVFGRRPKLGDHGCWGCVMDDGSILQEKDVPIKLKPGEGPVKVKLVKA